MPAARVKKQPSFFIFLLPSDIHPPAIAITEAIIISTAQKLRLLKAGSIHTCLLSTALKVLSMDLYETAQVKRDIFPLIF